MNHADDRLKAVHAQLKKGIAPQPETVRSFLLWFGVERRGLRVVRNIRQKMEAYGLVTVPDFEYYFIDSEISFDFARTSVQSGATTVGTATADPTYRVGRLGSAHKVPSFVRPDASLSQAVTIMLANDYSQLPVMTGPRDVKGCISWKTIGRKLAIKRPCVHVRDCLEPAQIISVNESFFSALATISMHDYVLVQADDKVICGIVTAVDFNEQFRLLAEPFLLIGEIENGVRQIIHGIFTEAELRNARAPEKVNKTIESVFELTFGEYIRLIDNDRSWKKLLIELDRQEFVSKLNQVRELRNDIMHFDPEGLQASDTRFLREFALLLKWLRDN